MDKHFLYFSKAERIGIIVLLSLCAALFIIPPLLPDRSASSATDFSDLQTQIAAWEGESDLTENQTSAASGTSMQGQQPTLFDPNSATEDDLLAAGLSPGTVRSWMSYLRKGGQFKKWSDIEKFRALTQTDKARIRPYLVFGSEGADKPAPVPGTDEEIVLYPFDPNKVTKGELMDMGLPARVANNWERFLASGGHFRKADDIQKIYGLTPSDFDRLLPYAVLDEPDDQQAGIETFQGSRPTAPEAVAAVDVVIDINRDGADKWQQLKGIGPAYSRRILNFRDKLGGFSSVAQIKETYGLPDSVYQVIYSKLRPSPIFRKLDINTLTVEELAAHPYLRFSDARLIVRYREEHGPFRSPADLDKLYGLAESTKEKMKPYWSFE